MTAAQTAGKLKKFLESMIQKSGKLRSLSREIAENYSRSSQMMESSPQNKNSVSLCQLSLYKFPLVNILRCWRQHKNLKTQLQKLDEQYDILNNLLAEGEVLGFKGEPLAPNIYFKHVVSDLCASEHCMFIRSEKNRLWKLWSSPRFVSKATAAMNTATYACLALFLETMTLMHI